MKRRTHRLSALVLGALLVTGCATEKGRYPSLAVRDAEREIGQFTPSGSVQSDSDPIRPVASTSDILSIVERAQTSHQRFISAQFELERLVSDAQGRDIESNQRQLALVGLADLTTLRSDTAIALGDLDLLEAQARTTFAPAGEIVNARAIVLDLIGQQDATLDSLWTELER